VDVENTPNRITGPQTVFKRGSFGSVRQVLAQQGTTTYDVDDWGRARSVIDPALGSRSFVYNGFDELVRESDARGVDDLYEYDDLGRLIEKRDSDGGVIARWDFDGDPELNQQGRLVASWRRAATGAETGTWILNHYGPEGLPSAAEYHVGATLGDRVGGDVFLAEYSYDPEVPGRLSEIAYPSNGGAFRTRYKYDSTETQGAWSGSGAVRQVLPLDDQGMEGAAFWTLTDADEGYRLRTEEFGNGVVSTRSYYDPSECIGQAGVSCGGRLKSITTDLPGDSSSLVEHRWDSNGNLASLQRDNLTALLFEYDSLDRLTREYITAGPQNDQTVRSYAYNAAGDLTSKTGAGTYDYVPRASGNGTELHSVGNTTYSYDDNGNQEERIGSLAQGGYQKLDYNDFDMPHQIISGEGIGRSVTSLEYTSSGQRVRERTTQTGIITERVYVGDLYQRTENSITPLAPEHRYKVLVGSRQVAEVVRHGSDDDTDDVFYLHDDHLGSVTAITDAGGGAIETRSYEPFGTTTSSGDPTGVRSAFTGHDADTAVGLVNARGRLYDPKIGRFLTADPFVTNPRSSQGWNRYAYVENNPLGFTDPSGFDCTGGEPNGSFCPPDGGPCTHFYRPVTCGPTQADSDRAEEQMEEAQRQADQAQRDAVRRGQESVTQPTITDPSGVPGFPNPPPTREQNWEAAKAGAWNWLLDQAVGLTSITDLIQNPSGFGQDSLSTTTANAVANFLRTDAPTNPRLREQYDFMRNSLTVASLATAVAGAVGGGAAAARRGGVSLFHGTDAASAESIVARGLSAARAAVLGGGDSFWATADRPIAGFFARANPAGGAPAVVEVHVPQAVISSLERQGALEVQGSTYRFSGNAWNVLNEFATFLRMP
jgi:RHS repeat-associated protein